MTRTYDAALVADKLTQAGLAEQMNQTDLHFSLCLFEKGELLSSPLAEQTDIYFLCTGTVQFYALRPDGQLIPVGIGKPGAMIGDVEYAGNGFTALYAEAKSKVECLALNLERNREILQTHVPFLHYLICSLCSKVYLVNSQDQLTISVEDKLLLHLQTRCQAQPLTNITELANAFGCSRRQLERVIGKLCRENVLHRIRKGCYVFDSK